MPAADRRPGARRPFGTVRLGSIGGSDLLVSSSWLGIAALIALAVAPHVEAVSPGLGWVKYAVGVVVAVMLYLAVLLHEASHVVVVRHYGHRVPSITLTFMGGSTAVEGEARTPGEEFWSSVVGPVTSLAIGALALLLAAQTPDGVLSVVVQALAYSNLGLGVLNLVPVLPLDGGRVLKAGVWRATGSPGTGVVVAAWTGRVAAVLLAVVAVGVGSVGGYDLRLLDVAVLVILAVFLWTSSTAELRGQRLRARFAALDVAGLARPFVAVTDDVPLSEAMRRAQKAGARSILTTDAVGVVHGVVVEARLGSVPGDQRPWIDTARVTRPLTPELVLPADVTGSDLLAVLQVAPATEYVLTDAEGAVVGVVSLSDVDRAVGLR